MKLATVLVATALLGACSSAQRRPSPRPTVPEPSPPARIEQSPSPTPTVYATHRCTAEDLRADLSGYGGGVQQQEPELVTLTNVGATACFMEGYPGITVEDSQGRTLPFEINRHGDEMVTSHPPHRVAVPPHGVAYVLLNQQNCAENSDELVTVIHIVPPGDTRALTLPKQQYPIWAYCHEAGDPGRRITVSPVESNENDVSSLS